MSRRHRKPARRRTLKMETLEDRRLLVVGEVLPEAPPQNAGNPEDTNYDGSISPSDALLVINRLNYGERKGPPAALSLDVDGDGTVSPRDALLVVNRLNSRSNTSSVPPEQRAIGLRKALDAGILPPKLSLSEAEEMLETLENGGHYEAGERYRNGQMININRQPEDLGSAAVGAESTNAASTGPSVDWTSGQLLPEATSPKAAEENDPLTLLDSPDETLSDPLYDSTLWHAFWDATDPAGTGVDDRSSTEFAERLAERLASENAKEHLARVIADAVQSGDQTAEDIIDEVAALQATLGDANSQIAQLFANLDIQGIIEQIGIDLGTLAEAMVSSDYTDSPYDDAYMAEFLSREYLDIFD